MRDSRRELLSPDEPSRAALKVPRLGNQDVVEQYLILMSCRDERHQVELLERFRREGMECKALLS